MYDNYYTHIKEGKASFWFDNWLANGHLAVNMSSLNQPIIQVKDYYESNAWNSAFLIELVGEDTTARIVAANVSVSKVRTE